MNQSGLIFGYTALVDGLVRRINHERDEGAEVVARAAVLRGLTRLEFCGSRLSASRQMNAIGGSGASWGHRILP